MDIEILPCLRFCEKRKTSHAPYMPSVFCERVAMSLSVAGTSFCTEFKICLKRPKSVDANASKTSLTFNRSTPFRLKQLKLQTFEGVELTKDKS